MCRSSIYFRTIVFSDKRVSFEKIVSPRINHLFEKDRPWFLPIAGIALTVSLVSSHCEDIFFPFFRGKKGDVKFAKVQRHIFSNLTMEI